VASHCTAKGPLASTPSLLFRSLATIEVGAANVDQSASKKQP
jgi:hypothetical protein